MIKSFKIRLYPTKEQEILLWKHVGCCRFIWNYMLNIQDKMHINEESKYLKKYGMMNLITELKKQEDFNWLNEVSRTSLNVVCTDLHLAYLRFFDKKTKHPRIKKKKNTIPRFPVRYDTLYFDGNKVNVEKVGKVKYKTDFNLPVGKNVCKFTNPRISYVDNKWLLVFGMECENQALQLTDKSMGIDLGVKDLAIVAFGDEKIIFNNINKSKKMRDIGKKIKYLQKSVCRKYEQNKQGKIYVKTNNIIKQENKIRKLYRKQHNIRFNYIHQTTHFLVSLLPQRVVMENLNVKGLLKNRHLARAIQEQCFSSFKEKIKYKCEFYGIEFIECDTFFPSSKTCSCCGNVKKELKLSERKYICDECGFEIDRDYNAAINLMRYKV